MILCTLSVLRTVPTKYGGFCAKLGPCGQKVDLCESYWNPKRKNNGVAMHFSEIISLKSQQKCRHHHLSEKIRKQ